MLATVPPILQIKTMYYQVEVWPSEYSMHRRAGLARASVTVIAWFNYHIRLPLRSTDKKIVLPSKYHIQINETTDDSFNVFHTSWN